MLSAMPANVCRPAQRRGRRNLTLQRSNLPPPKARKGICLLQNHLREFGGSLPDFSHTTCSVPTKGRVPYGKDRVSTLTLKKWLFGC